jgi:hypothetical protein
VAAMDPRAEGSRPASRAAQAIASPDAPQRRHHARGWPSFGAGQTRNRSRPPQMGQGPAHSPPLVEHALRRRAPPSAPSTSGRIGCPARNWSIASDRAAADPVC